MITREMLRAFAPRPSATARGVVWDGYVTAILDQQKFFSEYGINSDWRLAHLMAQWGHESGGFTILWESGAYSAQRIVDIFGVGRHSANISYAEAEEIAGLSGDERTETLFERVYGLGNPKKAKELGNTDPGDGARYRGWGIGQLTGKRDHERLVRGDYSYRNAVKVALIEWQEKGCNRWADSDDIRRVTKAINGGYNGLADRERRLSRAKEVFAGALDDMPRIHVVRPNGLDPDPPADAVAPPAAPTPEPAPQPVVKVKDLAAIGSSKAGMLLRFRTWAWRTLGIGAAGTVVENAAPSTAADIKGQIDAASQAFDLLRVASQFAKDNLLLLLVVGGGVGLYFASKLGTAMVNDFNEGRYRPREGE